MKYVLQSAIESNFVAE